MAKTTRKTETVASLAPIADAIKGNNVTIADALTDEQKAALQVAAAGTPPKDNDVIEPPKGSLTHSSSNSEGNPEAEVVHYKPQHTITEAVTIAQDTVRDLFTVGNEVQGKLTSRLAMAFADMLAPMLNAPKGTKQHLSVSENTLDAFLSHIKGDKKRPGIFKSLITETRGDQNDILNVVDLKKVPYSDSRVVEVLSPWKGHTADVINAAAMFACLLVMSDRCGVKIGYIRNDQTRGVAFGIRQTFAPREQIPDDVIDEYMPNVCVEMERLYPSIYGVLTDDATKTSKLVEVEKRNDKSLRNLTRDAAYALYHHVYAGKKLVYDVEIVGGKKPSGMLMKQEKQHRGARGQNKAPAATTTVTPTVSFAGVPELRKALAADINSTEHAAAIDAQTAILASPDTASMNTNSLISYLRQSEVILRRTLDRFQDKELPGALGLSLVHLQKLLQAALIWDDKKGEWHWCSVTVPDKVLTVIKEPVSQAA